MEIKIDDQNAFSLYICYCKNFPIFVHLSTSIAISIAVYLDVFMLYSEALPLSSSSSKPDNISVPRLCWNSFLTLIGYKKTAPILLFMGGTDLVFLRE